MKFDRATLCLPIANRAVSHVFYTALGFSTAGEPGDDGLPEPLRLEVSDGLRVTLIPTGGFGRVIGGRDRSARGAHECMTVVGLPSEGDVDDLMRRAGDADAEIVYAAANQSWGPGTTSTPTRACSPTPTGICGRSAAPTVLSPGSRLQLEPCIS